MGGRGRRNTACDKSSPTVCNICIRALNLTSSCNVTIPACSTTDVSSYCGDDCTSAQKALDDLKCPSRATSIGLVVAFGVLALTSGLIITQYFLRATCVAATGGSTADVTLMRSGSV